MSKSQKPGAGVLAEIGTVLSERYELVRFVGAGGFAEVYEAQQLSIRRSVAVKVLDLGGVSRGRADHIRKRFAQEAVLAARIKHPNAVTIFDEGITETGLPYMVQELLDGVSLEQALEEEGGFAPLRAISLMVECLDGLDRAHKQEIIHRDLKPSNLFVVDRDLRAERLCILDFGLAFAIENDTRLTAVGQLNGTPRYLSPEYIQFQTITAAMDVYQMGLILVEMMTGVPVVADTKPYACLVTHTKGELEIPTPIVESRLFTVVKQALALDPKERYRDAGAFRDALADQLEALRLGADDDIARLESVRHGRGPTTRALSTASLVRVTPGTKGPGSTKSPTMSDVNLAVSRDGEGMPPTLLTVQTPDDPKGS